MTSEKILYYRLKSRLTQQQVADRLGVTKMSVSQWETGVRTPNLITAQRLCKVLHCELEDITDDRYK